MYTKNQIAYNIYESGTNHQLKFSKNLFMKEESTKLIKETLDNWRKLKHFTYQQKEVAVGQSPIVDGEVILRFTNTLHGFLCKGQEIPISLTSRAFHTTTLSPSPLSQNASADKFRLEKILKEFDDQFDALIDEKLTECEDVIYTTDPLFF